MMRALFYSKSDAAILLIALGIGYILCYLANREKKILKSVGLAIGIFIIVSSSLLLFAKLFFRINTCIGIYRTTQQHKMMMK